MNRRTRVFFFILFCLFMPLAFASIYLCSEVVK